MCPDRKLQWFVDNEWPLEVVVRIRQMVVRIFNAKFKPQTPVPYPVAEDNNGSSITVCNHFVMHSTEP